MDKKPDSMNKVLKWFAVVWAVAIIALNCVAIVGFFVTAPTILAGWSRVTDIYSPFNLINWIAEVVVLAPALGAVFWSQYRQGRGLE